MDSTRPSQDPQSLAIPHGSLEIISPVGLHSMKVAAIATSPAYQQALRPTHRFLSHQVLVLEQHSGLMDFDCQEDLPWSP